MRVIEKCAFTCLYTIYARALGILNRVDFMDSLSNYYIHGKSRAGSWVQHQYMANPGRVLGFNTNTYYQWQIQGGFLGSTPIQ